MFVWMLVGVVLRIIMVKMLVGVALRIVMVLTN